MRKLSLSGLLLLVILSLLSTLLYGENYLLKGRQASRINYSLTQRLVPIPGTKSLIISTVVPSNYQSPTYNQEIENLAIDFSPPPSNREEKIDKRGNKVIVVTWANPSGTIIAKVSYCQKLRALQSARHLDGVSVAGHRSHRERLFARYRTSACR